MVQMGLVMGMVPIAWQGSQEADKRTGAIESLREPVEREGGVLPVGTRRIRRRRTVYLEEVL